MMEEKKILHCAIYTRKSTEEGLDMDYSTLDAQREAGEKYVEAMRGEGWRIIPDLYDDGGFSGGNMDRPALKRLIEDIKGGRIDIVVVYKVDRLSRSLMDFAKLVEVLDAHGVSFVSVTQHFNTKDSMGRLTLNILLSFAQFEREVTGERIRDKFASSKMKGMWMGGPPPLGYDVADRKLVTNPKEAELVNLIFNRFVALGSISLLTQELNKAGYRTKHYISRTGKPVGGKLFTENPLRTFLKNRLFLGEIHHKGKYFPGLHQPIITQAQFDAAQAVFAESSKGKRKRTYQAKSKALLKGLLVCGGCGGIMSPTHTNKGKKNYHYYSANSYRKQSCELCPANRIPAGEIEDVVKGQLQSIFVKPQIIVDVWKKVKADIPNYSENELHSTMQRMGSLWNILVPAEQRRIMEGFERAAVIRSKDGWWLAIPTPNAPKRGVGGKRINPSNFPEHRYGRLRFVYRSGKPSLLVVDNARASYSRKTGELRGFRKASDRAVSKGQGLTTVVMFWLVPQVQMKRLITFDAEAKRWFDRLPQLILKNWPD